MAIPSIAPYSIDNILNNINNKVDWQIDPQRAVLLVHDMQQYFIDFYNQSLEPISEVIDNISQIKQLCNTVDIPVVYTAQPGDQDPNERALLTDFWGAGLNADPAKTKIIDALTPNPNDTQLVKWRYSAFVRSELKNLMQHWQRDQLIIVGVYSHIGCLQTAADAFMNDIQAFMVIDAQADFSFAEQHMAATYVAGRCGQVTTTAQTLSAISNTHDVLAAPMLPTSYNELVAQVAALLELDQSELTDDDSLLDFGLDSVRMMSLVADWQTAGLNISFIDLAATPCLGQWWSILQKKAA
ncbi:isochorismatase family protein [Algibacillus agarilyticus]|uniref:isochorismatase family protein n=1 Tax=Algibacillus agarilyticus TaxID=2234133 RepID=UPI000DCF84F1|nr:isochorismatase family protein [Algibacillus agarilyticus]